MKDHDNSSDQLETMQPPQAELGDSMPALIELARREVLEFLNKVGPCLLFLIVAASLLTTSQ